MKTDEIAFYRRELIDLLSTACADTEAFTILLQWLYRRVPLTDISLWCRNGESVDIINGLQETIEIGSEEKVSLRIFIASALLEDAEGIQEGFPVPTPRTFAPSEGTLRGYELCIQNCYDCNDHLASLVFMRPVQNGSSAFVKDKDLITAIEPVFAACLVLLLNPNRPDSENDEEVGGQGEKRIDDADWWKNGRKPPF